MTSTTQHTPTLSDDGLELVERPEDIPAFGTEEEERAYWETHTFGQGMIDRLEPARAVDPRLPPPRACPPYCATTSGCLSAALIGST